MHTTCAYIVDIIVDVFMRWRKKATIFRGPSWWRTTCGRFMVNSERVWVWYGRGRNPPHRGTAWRGAMPLPGKRRKFLAEKVKFGAYFCVAYFCYFSTTARWCLERYVNALLESGIRPTSFDKVMANCRHLHYALQNYQFRSISFFTVTGATVRT